MGLGLHEQTLGLLDSALAATQLSEAHHPLVRKAAVVGTTALLGGRVVALLSFAGATVLLGDRPAPLNPWSSWVEAFAHFLPETWQLRISSIVIPNLAPEVAGADTAYLLSPAGAAGVMVAYVVVALGAGALSFHRRDA